MFASDSPARLQLGELIAIAWDEARSLTSDETEVARLTAVAVAEILAGSPNEDALRDLAAGARRRRAP